MEDLCPCSGLNPDGARCAGGGYVSADKKDDRAEMNALLLKNAIPLPPTVRPHSQVLCVVCNRSMPKALLKDHQVTCREIQKKERDAKRPKKPFERKDTGDKRRKGNEKQVAKRKQIFRRR